MASNHDPVRLRRRATKDGGASLYLDIYTDGVRRYEYLHLYLLPDTRANKAKNAETLALAEAVRAKRLVEVRNNRYDFSDAAVDDVKMYDYFGRCLAKRKACGGQRWRHWNNTLKVLRCYERREGLMLRQIDRKWCEGWLAYLRQHIGASGKHLSRNTADSYNKIVRAMFNDAVRDGLLERSPMATVAGVGAEETMRAYLTADELQRLAATPCDDDMVRRAFLFACLTGLRRSDIDALRWSDIKTTDNGVRLELRQRKTQRLAYIDITPDAVALLPDKGENADDSLVFWLPAPNNTGHYLAVWVARAGIGKHITFHCARHTFATLLLTRGADLYTVSKLLGHRSIATTQIYGKIVDERRRAAVSLLDGIVGD